jgi:hypothetical protein
MISSTNVGYVAKGGSAAGLRPTLVLPNGRQGKRTVNLGKRLHDIQYFAILAFSHNNGGHLRKINDSEEQERNESSKVG